MALLTLAPLLPALVVPLAPTRPASVLASISLASQPPAPASSTPVSLGEAISSSSDKQRTLLVLGTHAADFNMIEYCQRVRHFLPQLREKQVSRFLVVVNSGPEACAALRKLLSLPEEIELLSDPEGEAGRRFGVSRGWQPDNSQLSPYLKLYLMLFGLGPPATIPAVLTGYIGNPSGKRGWIESALLQGQLAGRWPDNVLEIDPADASLKQNNFDELPLVGGWGRRPLELATLRLQNLKMAFDNWSTLKPTDTRCLTQLGGCVVVGDDGQALYSWVDNGICDVPDFDELIDML